MPPRAETRRCTVTGPDGGGGLAAARRAPRSRGRSPGGNRAGHGPRQLPVAGDDHHLGAVHPQDDALPSQLVADVELGASQADQAAGVDRALHLHGRAGPGQQRGRTGRAGAIGGQPGQLDYAQPGRQRLDPGAAGQYMQADLVHPDGDLPVHQGRAKPDLLPANPQVA